MEAKKVLDMLVDLNMATSETDVFEPGDLVYYLHTQLNESDGITIPKKFFDFFGCDEIFVYLKDSGDENDKDMIELIYKAKK